MDEGHVELGGGGGVAEDEVGSADNQGHERRWRMGLNMRGGGDKGCWIDLARSSGEKM